MTTDTTIRPGTEHRSESRALDCWAHGVAHLVAAMGVERALHIAACTVLAIAENDGQLRDRAAAIAAIRGD